jgi:hypothetical protein
LDVGGFPNGHIGIEEESKAGACFALATGGFGSIGCGCREHDYSIAYATVINNLSYVSIAFRSELLVDAVTVGRGCSVYGNFLFGS